MNLNKQMTTKQTVLFIIVITIALFIVQQVAYGQLSVNEEADKLINEEANRLINEASNSLGNLSYADDPTTPWNETADPERTEAELEKKQLKREMMQTMKTQLELIINNCYVHSDRPNPVQDLIDKGLLNAETWKNETCKSVKETYDLLVSQQ